MSAPTMAVRMMPTYLFPKRLLHYALGLLILFIGVVHLVFAAAIVRILPRWVLFLTLLLAAFVLFAAVFGLG